MGKETLGPMTRNLMKKIACLFCLFFIAGGLSSVCAQGGLSIRALFERGQQAFEERRYQDAINDFEAVIELNNSFAWAYHALGLVYDEVSADPYYPLWYFQTAVQIDPDFAPSYDMLCRSYYQLQKYREAEAVCLKALELDPDLVSSQLSLAWVYLIGRSDPDRAMQYFNKVIQKINTPFIHFGMGMVYAMRGEHGRVLEIVTMLRAEGMEEFAAHLESIVRSKTSPEKFLPPGAIKGEPQIEGDIDPEQFFVDENGRIIVPVPVPVVMTPTITGEPEVHITGKIGPPKMSITGAPQPETYGAQKERHPGSLSE